MADKANWEGVSITEDNEVIAEGGFNGITTGQASTYNSNGSVNPNDKLVIIDCQSNGVALTIDGGGKETQVMYVTVLSPSGVRVATLNIQGGQTITWNGSGTSETATLIYGAGIWNILTTDGTIS